MRFFTKISAYIYVSLAITSCGNSNGYNASTQSEVCDTVIAEEIIEEPSSNIQASEDDITPDDVIRSVLSEIKSSLPIEMANGMTITNVYVQGSYLFYRIECDDNFISVYDLADNMDEAHDNVLYFISTMVSNDDNFALMIAALVEKRMGICYRYVSDVSGDYLDIKIKYSELSRLF